VTLSDRVAEEIRGLLGKRRMSASELARRLEVSRSWVSLRLTNAQAIDLNDAERIAYELDVTVGELLGLVGRELPDEIKEIMDILDDEEIPKDQRDQLLRVVRRLVPVWQEMRPIETPTRIPRKRATSVSR
jgi:transcriptional regulator with XRE-family HTH domain